VSGASGGLGTRLAIKLADSNVWVPIDSRKLGLDSADKEVHRARLDRFTRLASTVSWLGIALAVSYAAAR
jgi:hypothetical protein